jgi:AcrR family transcriptional regulator
LAPEAIVLDEKPAADDKRARLLEAALELFETQGFDGVAVPQIAAKAGVATGTVYRYFAGKEALVNALYREWKGVYNAFVLAPLPPELGHRARFVTYWRRMMAFARTYPRAVRFMDLHHHAAYLDAESIAISRVYRAAAEAFVTEAVAAGALRPIAPALIVSLLWGAAAGLVKFAEADALTLDTQAVAAMEDALWRAVANEPS